MEERKASGKQSYTNEYEKEIHQVIVTVREVRADTIFDLLEATPKELRQVRLSLQSPRITVDLWTMFADVTVDDDDDDAKAVSDAIRTFVRKRRTVGSYVFGSLTLSSLWVAFVLEVAGLLYAVTNRGSRFDYAVPVITLMVVVPLMSYLIRRGSVRVRPVRRHESFRVSRETRRSATIALVSAVAGAVIVAVAGLWAGLLSHK